MASVFDRTIVITGPTASGKSSLALEFAEQANGEIVSMDSMAVYRGMDIGTATPSEEDRNRVAHHLISVLEPWQSSSVSWWLSEAERCLNEIHERKKLPVLVGGTPLYLKALMFGLFDGPPQNAAVRTKWEGIAKEQGATTIHRELDRIDPDSAARLHVNDVRRVVRALEVWETTGRPLSEWQQEWRRAAPVASPRCVWINRPRQELYKRINDRVVTMFADGFVHEAEKLRSLPAPMSREAKQALGYKELWAFLDGESALDETIARVQTRTRQFAKRQLTWFRNLPNCRPLAGELTIDTLRGTIDEQGKRNTERTDG